MSLLVLMLLCCGDEGTAADRLGAGFEPDILTAMATESLDVYLRPDSAGSVWFTLPPGESVDVMARTAGGWLGFDPGVAQAGNSGSFRYRWLPPGGPYSLDGDSESLGVVWGPVPEVAYAMTFDPVPVYLEPDSLSTVVGCLPENSAAAIEVAIQGWFEIDPSDGPSQATPPGWVRAGEVSINGEAPSMTRIEDN